jgi:hypothetical protein
MIGTDSDQFSVLSHTGRLWRDNLGETRASIWMGHDSRDGRMIVAARQERKPFML